MAILKYEKHNFFWKIGNFVWSLIMIAQIKRLDTLNATQINRSALKSPVFENNQEKLPKIGPNCIFCERKKGNFCHLFWIFSRKGAFQRACVLCAVIICSMTLNLSYHNQWLEKIQIFPKNCVFHASKKTTWH